MLESIKKRLSQKFCICIIETIICSNIVYGAMVLLPYRNETHLIASITMDEIFSAEMKNKIKNGIPYIIEYKVKLAKKKLLWQKQLISEKRMYYIVSYNRWKKVYELCDEYDIVEIYEDIKEIEQKLKVRTVELIELRELIGHSKFIIISEIRISSRLAKAGLYNMLKVELNELRKKERILAHVIDRGKELIGLKDKIITEQIEIEEPYLLKFAPL